MCVTDPPYNVAYEGKGKDKLTIKNDSKASEEFRAFLRGAFTSMAEALAPGAPYYVWFATREHMNFEGALNDIGIQVREELIWNKNAMTLGRQDYQWKHEPCLYGWKEGAGHKWYGERDKTTVLDFDKPAKSDMHPTMKPIPLFATLIQNSSRKGDVVLDIFGGSGTTLMACEQIGRRCRMIELDPIYCQVIINRWEEYTGKKAEKIA